MDRHIQVARDLAQATQGGVDSSGYRTRWLMAHNRLHALVHKGVTDPAELAREWNEYLAELNKADKIAQYAA